MAYFITSTLLFDALFLDICLWVFNEILYFRVWYLQQHQLHGSLEIHLPLGYFCNIQKYIMRLKTAFVSCWVLYIMLLHSSPLLAYWKSRTLALSSSRKCSISSIWNNIHLNNFMSARCISCHLLTPRDI